MIQLSLRLCAMTLAMNLIVLGSASFGQDPTMPSKAVMALMNGEPPKAESKEEPEEPKVKLKAIVLRDDDHGSAIIEIDERRVRLPLDRSLLNSSKLNSEANTTGRNAKVQIGLVQYSVEDFSPTAIVLSHGNKRLIVQ